jgi:hypothetical protein
MVAKEELRETGMHPDATPGRRREDDVAADAAKDRFERLRDHELDPDRGREVQGGVDRGHAVVDEGLVGDRALDELHRAGVVSVVQLVEVFQPTRAEVVEHEDVIAAGGEGIDQMHPMNPAPPVIR